MGGPSNFCHAAIVMLIKMRPLQNIQNLHNSTGTLPQGANDRIKATSCEDRKGLIKTLELQLELQLEQYYTAVKKSNKYFWPGVLRPEDYLAAEIQHDHRYIDMTGSGVRDCEKCATLAVKMYDDCFDKAWSYSDGRRNGGKGQA